MSTQLAFASSDGMYIDEHFGSAARFYLFNPDSQQPCAMLRCSTGEGHDSGRLAERIAALQGCHSVFCVEIGQGALRQVRSAGMDAVRVSAGSKISDVLTQWQAGEFSKAHKTDPNAQRFDQFLEEGWQS